MSAQRFFASICTFSLTCSLSFLSPASGITVSDSFDRANSTALGVTDVGSVPWVERDTNGNTVDVAEIIGNALRVNGLGGATSTDPGQAILTENFADFELSVQMEMNFNGLLTPSITSTNNAVGFMLRKPGTDVAITNVNANGQIDFGMYPGGGFLIRQNRGTTAGGILATLYAASPFDGSIVVGTLNNFAPAGTLPATIGGLPFDVNQNGVLEDGEDFTLGLKAVGDELTVRLNGVDMFNVNLLTSAPATATSYLSLMKNRHTGAALSTRLPFSPVYDNFTITGVEPPPPPPIIHVGDNDPVADESWVAAFAGSNQTTGAISDGGTPAWNIDDNGGGRTAFTRSLSNDQLAEVATEGFIYNTTMRMVDVDDAPDGGVEMSVYLNSNRGFVVWFGTDSEGNTLVHTLDATSPSVTLSEPFVTTPGYHDYSMIYDPVADSVDLYVDGALAVGDYPGVVISTTVNRVLWGSNSTAASGESNWTFAEFQAVPEPSALALVVLGVVGMAFHRRR